MAKKFVAPDLSNATPTSLLDEMGSLSLMENQIKKLRAVYKEAYYARTGIKLEDGGNPELIDEDGNAQPFPDEGVVKMGETFIATTTATWPERFDQKAFQDDDPKTFEKYKKAKPQLTTRFSLAEGVVNPVVNELLEQMKKELDLDD
jgi:hypothetical protein